jgi:hypothetical protein
MDRRILVGIVTRGLFIDPLADAPTSPTARARPSRGCSWQKYAGKYWKHNIAESVQTIRSGAPLPAPRGHHGPKS